MVNDLVEAKLGLSKYDELFRAVGDAVNLRREEDDAAYHQIDFVLSKINELSSDREMILTINKFFNYLPNFGVLSNALKNLKRQSAPNYRQCDEVLRIFKENLRKAEEISRGKKVLC